MNRRRHLVIATAILATAGMLMAPAAYGAITNPAKNPHRIVVQGDDGYTYVDGQDTLPGFDDVECTYIPGAWYDFDANRVYYADGQSIPWTEWDRIPGYDKWLAEKQAAQQPSNPSNGGGNNGGSNNSGSNNSGSNNGGNTGGSNTQQAAGNDDAQEVTEVAAATDEVEASASPSAEPSATPAISAEDVADEVAEQLDAAAAPVAEVSDASGIGRVLLIGLFGLGVITFLAYEIVRRRSGKSVA